MLDSSEAGLLLVLLLVFLGLNSFFSLIETAITESHRGRLEKMLEDGQTEAEAALEILENPERMLSLAQVGITQNDLDWIELNEAFAAQSLAVMRELDLDPARVNPLGGAIALGHPLGATGAIRTATVVHGLQRTKQRYGMVTMCIGTGMGAAGLFEAIS